MTPVGCRPSVGSSRSIFGHHPLQPIYVPQCNVCPWKRTGDAAFVKGVEDGDPQIGARATAIVKVDKHIELEFETVRPERLFHGQKTSAQTSICAPRRTWWRPGLPSI